MRGPGTRHAKDRLLIAFDANLAAMAAGEKPRRTQASARRGVDDGLGIEPVGAIQVGYVARLAKAIDPKRDYDAPHHTTEPRQRCRMAVGNRHQAGAGAQAREQFFRRARQPSAEGSKPLTVQAAGRGHRQEPGARHVLCDGFVGGERFRCNSAAVGDRQIGPVGGLDTSLAKENDGYLLGKLRLLPGGWDDKQMPPCHTHMPALDKWVLQYPPGTGFVLSLFPAGSQVVPLFAVCTLLIFAFAAAAILRARTQAILVIAAVSGAVALYMMINPTKASYSMAPTMVICAAAG